MGVQEQLGSAALHWLHVPGLLLRTSACTLNRWLSRCFWRQAGHVHETWASPYFVCLGLLQKSDMGRLSEDAPQNPVLL